MVLGIEISTSSIKGVIVDQSLGLVHSASWVIDPDIADVVSVDASKLLASVMTFIKGFILDYRDAIEVITLVTIWNSLVFLDECKGYGPVARARTWADTTGDQDLLEAVEDESSITGCPKHYKFTRWKLLKEINEDMLRKGYLIGTIADYIYWSLTDQWVISEMMASGSGLYALGQGQWYKKALSRLNISENQLPQLVDWRYKTHLSQAKAEALGLSAKVLVQVPNGDGGLNQYAESGNKLGIWSMSVGTSGAIRCLTKKRRVAKGLWNHALGDGYYVKGAAISGAGNCVQWFLSQHNLAMTYLADCEPGLRSLSTEGLPYYLPFMYGEQSPGWLSQRPYGYSRDTDGFALIDLYYSLIEGITFNLYQGYLLMIQDQGLPEAIVVSGGVTRSPFWLQLIADTFKQELRVSTIEHSSLVGAIRSYNSDLMPAADQGVEIVADLERHRELMVRFAGYETFYRDSMKANG